MLRVTKFLPRLAGQRQAASLVTGKYSSIFENQTNILSNGLASQLRH
ncbi:hypothetical protein FF38_08665, partial [Lucilia cuprina]